MCVCVCLEMVSGGICEVAWEIEGMEENHLVTLDDETEPDSVDQEIEPLKQWYPSSSKINLIVIKHTTKFINIPNMFGQLIHILCTESGITHVHCLCMYFPPPGQHGNP